MRRSSLAARLLAVLLVVECVGAGCAGPGPTSSPESCAPPCATGGVGQRGDLALPSGEAAQPLVLKGVLRHDADALSYSFRAAAGARLDWSYGGPAAHVVLTYPNGDSDGPFTTSPLKLPDTGLYVLSVDSNTMADDADGPFTLRLRLLPSATGK